MSLGNNIKHARKAAGLTQEDIAKEIGVSKQTVQKYESGVITTISSDKIEIIAKLLKTTPAKLMGWEDGSSLKLISPSITDDVVTFPVLGSIAAGFEEVAVEDWSGAVVEVPTAYLKGRDKKDFFVLEVRGNSMYPLYHEKDKVLILKQNYIDHNGDVGAVIYDGECATLKRVDISDDMVRLSPINPEYQPKELHGADLEMYHILGVPRLLIREIN
ncbi:MAG: LexA family protein [Acutalibacteraceae bacterium]|nr:MAG TPA: Repressor protein CI [Caudoviricetes sp.]